MNHQPIQVKITAKIISVDQSYLHDLGVNLNTESNEGKQSQQSSGDISKTGLHIVLASLRTRVIDDAAACAYRKRACKDDCKPYHFNQ